MLHLNYKLIGIIFLCSILLYSHAIVLLFFNLLESFGDLLFALLAWNTYVALPSICMLSLYYAHFAILAGSL